MKRITRITSCVLLLSLVLVGLGETDSLVLCIGFDGHISLENVEIGVCNFTLDKVADECGRDSRDTLVRRNASCCPCTDMDLPGKSLDYPELMGPDIVFITEQAETAAPLFESDCSELLFAPSGEIISRQPPSDPLDTTARISLRSVIILA
jgi:hypothetical protein